MMRQRCWGLPLDGKALRQAFDEGGAAVYWQRKLELSNQVVGAPLGRSQSSDGTLASASRPIRRGGDNARANKYRQVRYAGVPAHVDPSWPRGAFRVPRCFSHC